MDLEPLDLGYYDQPHEAPHEAIAETLDCAPSTASNHLQKAEAGLVRAVIVDIGVNLRGFRTDTMTNSAGRGDTGRVIVSTLFCIRSHLRGRGRCK